MKCHFFYQNINNLILGPKVKEVDAYNIYTSELKSISCYSTIPPTTANFDHIPNDILLNSIVYVPIGFKEVYANSEGWKNFWNIEETLSIPERLPDNIILNVETVELNFGESIQLEAKVLPDDTTNKTVTWNSSNENVASVSEDGLVLAVSEGSAIITATCGEVSAQCTITVLDEAGVDSLFANPKKKISVYTKDGILIQKDCKVEDINALSKGIYIIKSGNKYHKIAL